MKKIFFIFLLSISSLVSLADHLKGGWIYYEYLGAGSIANTSKYKITVKQYLRCDNLSSGQIDQNVFMGIFDGASNNLLQTVTIPLAQTDFENKIDFNCITNAPAVCYRVDQYVTIIDLTDNVGGYILSVQRCCRIINIINVPNSNAVGLTYTNKIPGVINGQSYSNNSSPVFSQNDTAIVCHNAPFTFDFSAKDLDGDSLSYSFTEGFFGGDNSPTGSRPNPPTLPPPPYFPSAVIPYNAGYSGSLPLGPNVTINSVTGIISGIAPATIGTYVVAVDVNEYRRGTFIGTTRKEIHIDVANCSLTAAQLAPKYITCDGFNLTFQNEIPIPIGSLYTWNFGDPASGINNTSSASNPTHFYSDTGIYKVKLKITSPGGCQDSATTLAFVYPGFSPGFISSGQCKNTVIQFTDTTKTKYGIVNSWSWNFGDPSTLADTSHAKNPTYIYTTAGNYDVSLFVTNSKGCSATVTQTVSITDKPNLTVTNDTLICSIDTLQLNAAGNGSFLWTPNYNINNQNSSSPLVSPKSPTTYYVTLTDPFGCKANDSVFVNVKQFVTIDAGPDTSICQGDAIQLTPVSDALHYKWSPSAPLNNDTAKYPIATPLSTTKFYVIGNIGKCQSTDSVTIKVSPYPVATAKLDTSICFGDVIQLHASGGSIYSWSPTIFLNNSNIADPIARPNKSIRYVVTISDTLGCAKAVMDTVVVLVQRIFADAGPRDTSIVIGQSLQLTATGGQFYTWTPTTGLSDPNIFNPVANITSSIDYIVKVSSAAGCFATDTISVHVYKVNSGLYVPNAFTPNGNGKNDVFKPIPIGIKQINYFKVFNRWGQMVFSTTDQNAGWDGTFKGHPQDSAVYVWIAEGVDYQDKTFTQKGIVTLIR
ncbi:MAG: PKD domain-containing protein [Bacteroidota bacterium]|nr:PKD domain-containing protein [Bacteroidota bacterium]